MKAAFLSVWNSSARIPTKQDGEIVISDCKKQDENLQNKSVIREL